MQTLTSLRDDSLDFSTVGVSNPKDTTLWTNLMLSKGASSLPNSQTSIDSPSVSDFATGIPSNFTNVNESRVLGVTQATLYVLLASGCLALVLIFFILAKVFSGYYKKTMEPESCEKGDDGIEYPMDGVFDDRNSDHDNDILEPPVEFLTSFSNEDVDDTSNDNKKHTVSIATVAT